MVKVMVCPLGTEVAGVNTRTGVTGLPETRVKRVMDEKLIAVAAVILRALTPAVKVTSRLDDILKPPVVAA
jgi:hypothetical protein